MQILMPPKKNKIFLKNLWSKPSPNFVVTEKEQSFFQNSMVKIKSKICCRRKRTKFFSKFFGKKHVKILMPPKKNKIFFKISWLKSSVNFDASEILSQKWGNSSCENWISADILLWNLTLKLPPLRNLRPIFQNYWLQKSNFRNINSTFF